MKNLVTRLTSYFYFILFAVSLPVWAEDADPLQLSVQREDGLYHITASFNTSLSPCAAYNFLTDYDAADQMPGVLESHSTRENANMVKVDRIGDEKILFFHVHLKSTLEFTEYPQHSVAFVQLAGDSKRFEGAWEIEDRPQGGSTFRFTSVWQPDTVIPLFIIDYFAKKKLSAKFTYMAQFAEQRKEELSASCAPQPASPLITAGTPPSHN